MKPNVKWINDWRIGLKPSRENAVATDLFDYFTAFWGHEKLAEKSKSTQNRYHNALSSLGGYLIEQSISEEHFHKNVQELLLDHIGPDEGPLICDNDENWQSEFDMVCRKVYHYNHAEVRNNKSFGGKISRQLFFV